MTDIPKPVSAAELADWLRERIRRGRLVPGQRLVEADISAETGAGRSKVREAFQRLEAEGLVNIEAFRGASVRRVSIEEIRQIYRARVALEGICAADFTHFSTPEQKTRLFEIQAGLDECVAERAAERFGRLNHDWHKQVIDGSGNQVVRDLLSRLTAPINRLLFESFYDKERLRIANEDHKAITAAIMAGDAAGAEAAMRRHVEDGFKTLSNIAGEFGA
ncbi:MAG TPA: GntR family transcriptional regulator [Sphingobium sp.]|nr:GntR family transcriptional regulator [Sphingobium sp.]